MANVADSAYLPFTTPEGVWVQLDGKKLRLKIPVGMTKTEALMSVQPYIDRANAATGLDIQVVLPDE